MQCCDVVVLNSLFYIPNKCSPLIFWEKSAFDRTTTAHPPKCRPPCWTTWSSVFPPERSRVSAFPCERWKIRIYKTTADITKAPKLANQHLHFYCFRPVCVLNIYELHARLEAIYESRVFVLCLYDVPVAFRTMYRNACVRFAGRRTWYFYVFCFFGFFRSTWTCVSSISSFAVLPTMRTYFHHRWLLLLSNIACHDDFLLQEYKKEVTFGNFETCKFKSGQFDFFFNFVFSFNWN